MRLFKVKLVNKKQTKNSSCNILELFFRVHDNSSKTISPIRQFVEYDFWSMRRSVEYDVWSKKLVRYDIRSKLSVLFSTKRRTQRRVASTKCHDLLNQENHKKSHGLPSSFASPTYNLLWSVRIIYKWWNIVVLQS